MKICIVSGTDPANQQGEGKNVLYFAKHISEPIWIIFPGTRDRSYKLGLQTVVQEVSVRNLVVDDVQREDDSGVSFRLVPSLLRKYGSFFLKSIPLLARFKPDVVHLRLPGAILLGIFSKVFFRSKVVITYHGPNIQKVVQSWLQRGLLRAADLVYYHSPLMRPQLLKIYPESKLVPDGPGVDLDVFHPLGVERRKQLLAIGHLRWYKGYAYMLDAFAMVLKSHPEYTLLIAGSGPLKEQVEQRISSPGLHGKVHLLGMQPAEKVCELLNQSQLFVMSSIAEGVPKAHLEAIACGTPSVVTSVCNCGDSARKVGLVVEPRDSSALAMAIQKLLEDRTLWQRCAENCAVVSKQFDWKVLTSRMYQSYQNLMG